MKHYFSIGKEEQESSRLGDTIAQLLRKFWRFSLYYGEFISQSPERRRGNLKSKG
jgi:hypothetical protein